MSLRWGVITVIGALLSGLLLHSLLGKQALFTHQILYNATVLTMDESRPQAEAIVIDRGRIAFVGNQNDALKQKRWYSAIVDLDGRTVIPGFIDAHSHFLATGLTSVALNLNPSPAGNVNDRGSLYRKVTAAARTRPAGEWILGFNYDNTVFLDGKHPDRYSLDDISTEHPIYLRHNSGHMGVANSVALERLSSVDVQHKAGNKHHHLHLADTASPYIGRYPDSAEPNGLLMEHSAPPLDKLIQDFGAMQYLSIFRQSVFSYASNGFTTVQEGNAGSREHTILRLLSRLSLMPLRAVIWLNGEKNWSAIQENSLRPNTHSNPWLTTNTIKLIIDGSPQGMTAFLSRPYYRHLQNRKPDYRGLPLSDTPTLTKQIARITSTGFRLAIHANGDAAIDQVLASIKQLAIDEVPEDAHSRPGNTRSITLVHAQTVRDDQLDSIAKLRLGISFFPGHTYYWGDWHRSVSLGPARAEVISPLASAKQRAIPFTIHSDAPVTVPNAMHMLWSASERTTRSGYTLGGGERIDQMSALRAMTVDAALQNGLNDRGQIKSGLLADLVVLSDNPLLVDDPRTVEVLETIVGGKVLYLHQGK